MIATECPIFLFWGVILRKFQRPALLLAALLAVPGAVVSAPAAATEPTAPLAVENFAYPNASTVLAEHGVTLKTGDGNIKLADCTSETALLRVRYTGNRETCFKVTGASGYLSMEIPAVFRIMSDSHTVKATMSAGGATSSVDLIKNEWKEVGTGANAPESMLLDLTATDGTAVSTPAPVFPAVGSITVGAPGRAGSRGCTGTLVSPLWVLTSAGCFTDTPATLPGGSPTAKNTFTVGGRSTDFVELVPRTDRDVVLARLAAPVYDVVAAKLAAAAPATGASVKISGFGRTATAWGTGDGPRTTSQGVGATSATGMDLAPSSGAVPVCAGDSGAPVLNAAGEIAGVVSRAWQAGCLGTASSEVRTGAQADRIDNLGTWVKPLLQRPANAANEAGGSSPVRWADFDGDHRPDYYLIADSGEVTVYLNRGGNLVANGWQLIGKVAKGATNDRSRVRLVDFDGDGKADYLVIGDGGEVTAFLNRGGDTVSTTTGWQNVGTVASGATFNPDQVRFADFDGDGKTDYLVIGDGGEVTAYLNRGGIPAGANGWQLVGKVAKGATNDRSRVRFADFDGDGKADYWVINTNNSVTTSLNRGGDTVSTTSGWQYLGSVAAGLTSDQNRVQFVDFTADSHADYLITGPNGATSVNAWAHNGGDVAGGGGWIDLGTVASGV
ncbi:FG-GAP-like repeat-containing protein [Kitasatospora sp. NPDC059646]|uniref:FG-GAP-like repeat-containing protein n=1 Tax=Kitasatospora sp. NPDC059646 TaxID=3346893 RepID=UPI003686F6ED